MIINNAETAPVQVAIEPRAGKEQLKTTCLADVEMKPINWLWEQRIACGKTTILAGDPGLGKSQVTAYLSAIVTNDNSRWVDGSKCRHCGNVLLLSAEDDPQDTIKPRLIAAGADVSHCHIIESVNKREDDRDCERLFNLTKDVERLDEAITRIGNVKLIIIDPISAYMGDTDSHNNEAMRGMLAPLSSLAVKHEVAILLVTHLNKSKDSNPLSRVIGSIGLIASARAGYVMMKDETDPHKRYFLPIKNNVGNDHDGFSYEIGSVTLDNGIVTSKIDWNEATVNANAILYPEAQTQTNGAKAFLEDLLAEHVILSPQEIWDHGEGSGYSKQALQRASSSLGVVKHKIGFKPSIWLWSLLPREDIEDTEEFKKYVAQCSLPQGEDNGEEK